jgi:molecular chaperone DnaJ
MLDERKLAVLRAIVEDYVSTTEPVGSKSLVDRHNLDVSPATIRNDMAVLEEQGFIVQPHTSAGRIPTDKGYRLFVDRLSGVKPLSSAERRAIETFLAGAYDLDDVVMRTVRLLAQLTRQVAVVQYPSLTRSSVRHVELVPLAAKRLMLVIITDTGRVEQRSVELPDAAEEDSIMHLRAVLNACLDGRRLTEVATVVADLPELVDPMDRPNAAAVFSVILESLVERTDERVVVGGAANLTTADFSKGLREVLESLEEQVVLMRLLGESGDHPSLTVRIGAENPVEGLRSTSVVATGYGTGDQVLARLGVLGPTRMDYPTAMGAVRAVARYVGQIPDPETQERFKEITQAYEVLSDPGKRQMYDQGADPFAPNGGAGAGGFGPGFPFSDIMDAFFGAGAAGRGPRSRARRGRNATIRVELDLSECAFGTTRELVVDTAVVCPTCSGEGTAPGTHPETCEVCGGRGEVSQVTRSFLGQVMTSRPCPHCGGFGTVIRRPCPECDGDGRVRTRRTMKVRIPAGVEDGTHIQLAGEGEIGSGGGPPGDLFLEILQRPHPIFERQGDDLHCTVTIPMVAAALGATLSVDTLDGARELDIRPGTQSGQVVPMYGLGVQHLNDTGRGDLVIHISVETPMKLDEAQEGLLKQLAALRGEETPPGRFAPGQQGFFSRLRDAFNGR